MPVREDIWAYRPAVGDARGIVGYAVEALDGRIGKVDVATEEVGAASIVVATGPWIFGRKVLLPAGAVDRIAREEERVYVRRTKEQVKNAPELGEPSLAEDARRDVLRRS
jgi:hypothetical protein